MGKSMYDQFLEAKKQYPNNIAVRFEQRTWTYASLDKSIDRCAKKLLALGIKPGQPVAVSIPNAPEAIYLFYAISEIGAVSYNIHPLTPPAMMKKLIERSGSHFLFCLSNSAYGFRQELDASVRIIAVNPYRSVNWIKAIALRKMSKNAKGIEKYWRLRSAPSLTPFHPEDSSDAVYLNTGGTNGEMKIVRLSNGAINYLALQGYDLIGGPHENIKILTAIPLFHGFGLAMGVHTPLSCGASTILILKFNTKEAIKHLRAGHATVIIGVPALFNALLSRQNFYGPWLKKQIVSFIGGDSVPQSLLDRWNAAMAKYDSSAKLYEGYGLTETVTVSNVNFGGHAKRGTIGKPLPGIEEKVIDVETRKEVTPNTLGEILISGPTLMSGYLNDSQLNDDVFTEIDGKKWLLTKDYGSLDEEGYLTFRQRLRRVVKVNGETLCPSDIEDVVLELNDVFEAYCYGVSDERKGSCFHLAVVIRRTDKTPNQAFVKEECLTKIKDSLPPAYSPEKIYFLDGLPRTPVGKIDTKAFETYEKTGKF
jgi:long-chain acyl-CoA synthetase